MGEEEMTYKVQTSKKNGEEVDEGCGGWRVQTQHDAA